MRTRALSASLIAPLVATVLFAAPARADDKAACLAAASKGQRFRATHKLVEAREQLRLCAAASCPAVVQSDCAGWLADVEKTLPTVVVTATSGAGASLVDVNVTLDGQPFASKLEGQAVPIDPGAHTLHFVATSGTLDQQVVVIEGEKNQHVAVVLGPKPATAAGGTTAEPKAGATADGRATWRTVGWIAGGAGVVGLAIGTIFGAMAISDNNSAQCNASNQCLAGPLSSARSAAVGADVGLIAGGVLLAGGVALVIYGSSAGGKDHATASAALVPTVGPGGGGLALGGSW